MRLSRIYTLLALVCLLLCGVAQLQAQEPDPMIGKAAPEFKLPAHTGGDVSLATYSGKQAVVLAFYPKDFTGGWELEIKSFQAALKRYEEANVQVLGISKDDIESHKGFAKHCGSTFPLLSDTTGKMAEQYGAFKAGGSYFNRRTIIIDKQGKVRHVQNGMPKPDELLKIIAEFK
jgi:thioredoxin-dependent peroxiredoxin